MKFKGRLTYRNFLDYLSNKLEKKEKHAFEKKIMQDSFDSEAFDGLSKLNAVEFEKDMADLNSMLQARTKEKKRRIPLWFPYAASVIVLLGLSLVLFYINQNPPADSFVSQEIEISKKESELDVIDTIPKSSKKRMKKEEDYLDVEVVEDNLELEIADVESSEELLEEELAVVIEEEVYEEIHIIETVKSKQVVAKLEIDDQQVEVPIATSKKVSSVLEGKAAGVAVSKSDSNIRIRGVSSIQSDEYGRKITGLVVDEEKTPMPGVMILVKGTNKGAITDLDGKFAMSLPDTNSDYKLTASFVGFEPKEVDLADSLLVVLEQDQTELSEVVVAAYDSSSGYEKEATSWQKAKPNQFASVSKFEDDLVKELMDANFEHLKGIHKVKFTFVVEVYGALSDIKFKGNPDAVLKKEVERLLLESGDWYPAESEGKAVSSKVRISLKLNFN